MFKGRRLDGHGRKADFGRGGGLRAAHKGMVARKEPYALMLRDYSAPAAYAGTRYKGIASLRAWLRGISLRRVQRQDCNLADAAHGFDGRPARSIECFWCYRTAEQTLLFVKLGRGQLYCLYMRRANGRGMRWIVHKIEGEEFGCMSSASRHIADSIMNENGSDAN